MCFQVHTQKAPT